MNFHPGGFFQIWKNETNIYDNLYDLNKHHNIPVDMNTPLKMFLHWNNKLMLELSKRN